MEVFFKKFSEFQIGRDKLIIRLDLFVPNGSTKFADLLSGMLRNDLGTEIPGVQCNIDADDLPLEDLGRREFTAIIAAEDRSPVPS